ncbi:hypothetical protein DPF_1033 [Desulfoplanes formicivorans]|uniref:Uncharacterized protein n=1 Tax=Desulfoplanes formicivorans TaxID=1592317 RepID=A0A194AE21_9BACT|nr:hypothetical protein DPF_1033 [Desulfoplanes formicivorans]
MEVVVLNGFTLDCFFQAVLHGLVSQVENAEWGGWRAQAFHVPEDEIGQIVDENRFDLIFIKPGLFCSQWAG